eukprot:COSAG06_NODE_2465_length_6822_cov_6.403540_1_plen_626_part_00
MSFDGVEAGSKRADQEMSWETHTTAKWGLRIVNALLGIGGIVLLALAGLMVSEESATTAALTPLIVVGVALLGIGALGIWATFGRKMMATYWLALFFGTVLVVWLFCYAVANFSKIENKVMVHFEENWAELVVSLPEELLDKVPRSCGGNKVNQCDFSVEGAATPGFADATAPTDEEAEACEAVEFEPIEGEDDLICVYEQPCSVPAACLGDMDADNDGEVEGSCEDEVAGLTPHTCTGTVTATGEDCEDLIDFMCDMVATNCPAGCTFGGNSAASIEATCNLHADCTFYPAEAGEALCVEITVESDDVDDEGRRLQDADDDESTETESFVLGSSEDFEAQCWNTIKDSMMANMKSVEIALIVCVVLQLTCMYWCIQVLTLGTALGSVRKAIDIGMTVAGGLLFITGCIMASELSDETLYLTVPCILLGALMLCLGVFFGCYSKNNPTCAKYAVFIYVFLFIVMAVMAFMCIAYEDTVRETVAEKGDVWLEKFCDTECYADIQAKMENTRDASAMCDLPPAGEEECHESYTWSADKHLDIACNSTAPNTISQICECPCEVAKKAADVKSATEEFIITRVMGSLNTMGWTCILISIYLFIEVICHLYNNHIAKEIDVEAADKPRGI